MSNFLKKLSSRKFMVALISIITGILTLFNCDENLIQLIGSIVMIIVPVITYIVTEGVLDHASIKTTIQQVLEAFEKYLESKEIEESSIENLDNIKPNEEKDNIKEITKE
jgi:intracellular septation protein A